MTIAACYLSSEGVVLGADSTSTMFVCGRGKQLGSYHHFDFAQKIFELGGPGSTAGVAIWGLGSLGQTSYRTLMAEVADEASQNKAACLGEVADRLSQAFWSRYTQAYKPTLEKVCELEAKGASRTPEESRELASWQDILSGGLCLAGRWGAERQPKAYEIGFTPSQASHSQPNELGPGATRFWGCPNLVERLLYGLDYAMFARILSSGKWSGTQDELYQLVEEGALGQPLDLPLREAIDWVYASIYTTIKAMKFSHLEAVCGGPIEVAVITSDRPFRWVRHKRLGEAIMVHHAREDHQ